MYPKHYCGIVGVFGLEQAARLVALALFSLQHRGEEGFGVVSSGDCGQFSQHKSMGLVAQVFAGDVLDRLVGQNACGHNRYSTTGPTGRQNLQPLVIDCKHGELAICHNGNLVNTAGLKRGLVDAGAIFLTTADSEILLHLIARSNGTLIESVVEMMKCASGAYSLVIMTKDALVGVRDPRGFRPLCIGKIGEGFVLASETCALDLMGATFVREVLPGEIVHISALGIQSRMFSPAVERSFCVFEYVYFARPDSMLDGVRVYMMRHKMGQELFREHPIDADVIVSIPDSGNPAAYGYSVASGIPVVQGYIKGHYGGRSFIQPDPALRQAMVGMKLAVIPELVRGKRVIVIDDSIVRGTTCRGRIRNLRDAGAQAVHVLASCPPHKHPCYYGINFPTKGELIAVTHQGDALRHALDADSVGYLSEDALRKVTTQTGLCMACYDGRYPIPIEGE